MPAGLRRFNRASRCAHQFKGDVIPAVPKIIKGRRMSLRALGGEVLIGEKLVRFVYLDESGRGSIEEDPWLVVAGVIVHADAQLIPIENHLAEMVRKYIPDQDRNKFKHFHAHEIFHGRGYWKGADPQMRTELLQELCSIPRIFKLPVIAGTVDRRMLKSKKPTNEAQLIASIRCCIEAEYFMRKHAEHEVTMLIYEDNPEVRKIIKDVHNRMLKEPIANYISDQRYEKVEFTKIKEAPLFTEKKNSSLLQVSDAIAFTFKRGVDRKENAIIFVGQYMYQFFTRPEIFDPSYGEPVGPEMTDSIYPG